MQHDTTTHDDAPRWRDGRDAGPARLARIVLRGGAAAAVGALALIVSFALAVPAGAAECLIRQTEGSSRNSFMVVAPGSTREWVIGVRNVTDDLVDTSLRFGTAGELAQYIDVSVDLCDVAWRETSPTSDRHVCDGATSTVLPFHRAVDAAVDTPALEPGAEWFGRATARLDDSPSLPNHLQGSAGTVTSIILANGENGTAVCSDPDPAPSRPTDQSADPVAAQPSGQLGSGTAPRPSSLAFTGATTWLIVIAGLSSLLIGMTVQRRWTNLRPVRSNSLQ